MILDPNSTVQPETTSTLSHKRSHLCVCINSITWLNFFFFFSKWKIFNPPGSSNKTLSRSGLMNILKSLLMRWRWFYLCSQHGSQKSGWGGREGWSQGSQGQHLYWHNSTRSKTDTQRSKHGKCWQYKEGTIWDTLTLLQLPLVASFPASHTPASHTPASHTPASHTPASHTPASHTPASHTPAFITWQ